MAKKKDLAHVLEHLEGHTRRLERLERQNLENTKKLERIEVFLGLVAFMLALLQVVLTLYFR